MDSDELYARVRRCLAAEIELFGSGSSQGHVERLPGVLASVCPATPDRSVFNSVMSDSPQALARVYDRLAETYRAAGVRAFTVWVDPQDTATAALLADRGHVLDSQPVAMGAELEHLQLPEAADLDWFETRDVAVIARINDAAWQLPAPAYAAAIQRLADPRWRGYVATLAGDEVGCLMVWDGDYGDAGISAVATLQQARGQGVATKLLSVALYEARARGCLTTTLQASPKGAPVYRELGYRELGAMQMWEHRTAA